MHLLLGTHQPSWLARTTSPLFLSFTRLISYQGPPRARGAWALDSGAYTELSAYGSWRWNGRRYAEQVQHFARSSGGLQWATIQDWICSPLVLTKTGLSIQQHQRRTVQSLCELRRYAPEVNWLPVLQGWGLQSYMQHIAMYKAAGFRLEDEHLVGVGSVASRQTDPMLPLLFSELQSKGLALHAFGLSILGLERVHRSIASADSMVWSFIARRRQLKHSACKQHHKVCNNCLVFALWWRQQITRRLARQSNYRGSYAVPLGAH
jgi:hypothetical protein